MKSGNEKAKSPTKPNNRPHLLFLSRNSRRNSFPLSRCILTVHCCGAKIFAASFPENLAPFPENLAPFPENLDPFPENLAPFPENLDPFPENLDPFPENLASFRRFSSS